jgi:hypothetical protein
VIVGVAKVGRLTDKLKEVVLLTPPPVAVTVTVDVALEVEPVASIVNVDAQLGAQEPLEKDAVTPAGKPEAANVTA